MKLTPTAIPGILFTLALLALGCMAYVFGSDVQTAAAQIPPPPCWNLDSVPRVATSTNQLMSVAAVSANDVWAVGEYLNPGNDYKTLVQHWDGTQWRVVPSPNAGRSSSLMGVSAVASNDVWAVGFYDPGTQGSQAMTLVLHWNGTAWSQVSSPIVGALNAVAAISANDVWAIGSYGVSKNTYKGLIVHWNGTEWLRISLPETGPFEEHFGGITAISANDVWVVGDYTTGDVYANTLALHWNGTLWSIVSTLNPGSNLNRFRGVMALSATDIWAVGDQCCGDNNRSQTLVERWDGFSWTVVPGANMNGASAALLSVAGTAANNIWAVGYSYRPHGDLQTLIERWEGNAWKVVGSPVNAFSAELNSVTAVENAAWAVGYQAPTAQNYRHDSLILSNKNTGASCAEPTPITGTATATTTPSVPLDPPTPLPGTGSRTFPETGKTVSGIFLKYWGGHGGLAQQGYPISQVMGEVSDLNGKPYTVQYFERAVFEYHPEYAGTPYEVLLSQLGTFQYNRKYPGGAPEQRPNNSTGSVLFPETGKRLGGKFLAYWQGHGGLAQQGYPISEEFTEISDLNGKPYTVQYFERVVMELHPENQPPYDVLLSQLGRLRYEGKYGGQHATISTANLISLAGAHP